MLKASGSSPKHRAEDNVSYFRTKGTSCPEGAEGCALISEWYLDLSQVLLSVDQVNEDHQMGFLGDGQTLEHACLPVLICSSPHGRGGGGGWDSIISPPTAWQAQRAFSWLHCVCWSSSHSLFPPGGSVPWVTSGLSTVIGLSAGLHNLISHSFHLPC